MEGLGLESATNAAQLHAALVCSTRAQATAWGSRHLEAQVQEEQGLLEGDPDQGRNSH